MKVILHAAKLLQRSYPNFTARVNMFLEVYGNLEVHEKTSKAMATYANVIHKEMAKDPEAVKPFFDLSLLKFRERDQIEVFRRSDVQERTDGFVLNFCVSTPRKFSNSSRAKIFRTMRPSIGTTGRGITLGRDMMHGKILSTGTITYVHQL